VIMTHRLSVLDRVLMIQELIIDARKLLNHPGLDMPHREEQLVALDRMEKELGLSSRRTES
jgi:hypothetical protein